MQGLHHHEIIFLPSVLVRPLGVHFCSGDKSNGQLYVVAWPTQVPFNSFNGEKVLKTEGTQLFWNPITNKWSEVEDQ